MTRKTSRRHFIRDAAAISTAAWGIPASTLMSAPATPSEEQDFQLNVNPLKLGLMTYKIGADWDIETIIENLQTTKIEHVELRTTPNMGGCRQTTTKTLKTVQDLP